jgi:hypothetical protein
LIYIKSGSTPTARIANEPKTKRVKFICFLRQPPLSGRNLADRGAHHTNDARSALTQFSRSQVLFTMYVLRSLQQRGTENGSRDPLCPNRY